MIDNKHLLDDKAMQDFIINGYTVVKPDLPQEFHRTVCEQALAITKSGRGFNNTLVAEIPMLQAVLDDPAVHGALTSVLGPNYVVNQHNACHYHPPGSKEQHWHKDYPLGGTCGAIGPDWRWRSTIPRMSLQRWGRLRFSPPRSIV